MADRVLHIAHLGIAESGKLALLAGDHREALRHLREAIRLAVSSGAPEIFFRHYTQCVLEALELAGDLDAVIAFCSEADAHYGARSEDNELLAKDHGSILERLGVARILADDLTAARADLVRAIEVAGPGVLPLAERLHDWLRRGFAVPPVRLRASQRELGYFVVRADTVDRRLARPLPKATRAPDPRAVLASG